MKRRSFLEALAGTATLSALGCQSGPSPTSTPVASNEVRAFSRIVPAVPTSDGAGVKLSRSLGQRALPSLDPFLMLDEIRSDAAGDYIKGFPDHPHRGFETVTYMIEGAMEHRDSVGNHGRLVGGSVQWMTAGSGLVHSEMPKQEQGLLFGFQLWVNLPRRLKMTSPRYQDLAPELVPEVSVDGNRVRVLAGTAGGATGPVQGVAVAPTMLDVTLGAGQSFALALPPSQNAFLYVLDGAVSAVGEEVARKRDLAVLGGGASARLVAREASRVLLLSGEPINEPIARRGPFVMNTEAELDQAFADYRAGRLG